MQTSRKEAILETATLLFAEKGFRETSTAEVAEQAGVAVGTLFYHFKTKEGIMLAVYEMMVDAYVAGIESACAEAGSGLDGLLTAIRYHFRFNAERSEQQLVLMRDFPSRLCAVGSPERSRVAAHSERILNVFRRRLEIGINDGSVRPVPITPTAQILRGMLYGLSRLHLLGSLDLPVPEAEALAFCQTALAATAVTHV